MIYFDEDDNDNDNDNDDDILNHIYYHLMKILEKI
jgi:hypothetical protein